MKPKLTNKITRTNKSFYAPIDDLELSWIKSINRNSRTPLDLSDVNRIRFELIRYYSDLEESGRTLYFLTLTYKPYSDRVYTPLVVNQFFTTFYVQHFLPFIFQTKNFDRPNRKRIQPITYAFLDDHAPKGFRDPLNPSLTTLVTGLHHHAILAVHPDTFSAVDSLKGENTLVGFSPKIMTSDLKPCDAKTVSYASKMMWKYSLELMFPDKTVS